MDNCAFLHIGGGICPQHTKKCDKPCEKYAVIGDSSKEIFHDWNNGIEELANSLREKYFGTTERLVENPSIENKEIDDIDDFLGE